ncbi:MAG: inorganic phosphate transporter [Acidobacteriota bacterium]
MEIYLAAIIFLALLAVSDIIVGVSNDAVNFLNSSIGSRVASKYTIFIIASFGLLAGVTFSKGMMEVARKGIFHPKFFTMPELITIFLAVMLTDILLLDLFNSYGLPTSTTVSIVFELLGAAVAMSIIKVLKSKEGLAGLIKYINTGKALAIIMGILLSVVIAFTVGAIIQFFSRLIFTFEFNNKLKKYGALWGGLALTSITYFIVIKGAKGSTFITSETLSWIKSNTMLILLISFLIFSLLLEVLLVLTRINILKIVVLIGTFALAMAFAANDLVNFIGVPLAGLSAYKVASTTAEPLTSMMSELQKASPSHTVLLIIAGIIMAVTLWFSRKARTVTQTEINLGRQDEGYERFGSTSLSRTIVRIFSGISESINVIIPGFILNKINKRFKVTSNTLSMADGDKPSFDLIRASVNLMVASVLISFATSMKLPLSTTYVTFMVAMGTSFADRAWGRDSAVYRITGVFTVIGGWFVTALLAFFVSGIFALILSNFKIFGFFFIIVFGGLIIYKNHTLHKNRANDSKDLEIFNLKKIKDSKYATDITFKHAGIFLKEVSDILNTGFEGMSTENRIILRDSKKRAKKISVWANIITANIFKSLRLLQKDNHRYSKIYAQTVNALQGIAESQKDLLGRAFEHIDNFHKNLLNVQIRELNELRKITIDFLTNSSEAMIERDEKKLNELLKKENKVKKMIKEFDENQVKRIQDESSKTRLSILFYGFTRDMRRIGEHTIDLLKIFKDSF